MSSTTASSVIVVEIDTRKGTQKSLFDSSLDNQNEQVRQFWKTLTLPPHIESSLYSKEISQLIKTNKLKPISVDNSRKLTPPDPKTEALLKNIEYLNHIDNEMRLQKRFENFQAIKQSHRLQTQKFNQIPNVNHYKQVPKLNLREDEDERNIEGPYDEEYDIECENEEFLVKHLE